MTKPSNAGRSSTGWQGASRGTKIAAELGINEQSLKAWKQKFKQLPDGQVAATLDALQAENRRLQREFHRAQQPQDILKKAWA